MAQDLFKHWYIKLVNLFSLAHSHRQNASYDRGYCGLSSCVTSSMRNCLLSSSSSRNKSLELRSNLWDLATFFYSMQGGKKTLHLAFCQPFFSIKEPIVLLICCFPHIAGHLLRVRFAPCLLAKVKSGREAVFNLLG